MLKISTRNKKLNERLAKKETQLVLHHLFRVALRKSKWLPYVNYWNSKLLIQSPFTKTRTICFLTGRSRSVYRTFHLSRMKLREFAAAGYLNGVSKASW